MLRIENIRVPVGEDESSLVARCAKALGLAPSAIERLTILRKSLDVRDRNRLEHVYTAAVQVRDESKVLRRSTNGRVKLFEPVVYEPPEPGETPLARRPVVVGAGPAGLFAALTLAELGYLPIVLERGPPVGRRVRDVEAFDRGGSLDPESNYLFGEGGAGTFSDGKLTCRTVGADTDHVLAVLARSKGKPSIVYESRPHLGSNRLPAVVKSLRRQIEAHGGEFRFSTRLEGIEVKGGRLAAVQTAAGRIETETCLLAIGHSARDTYAMLARSGVALRPKPFQMGVRIEQPQSNVNLHQFGSAPEAASLGAADYTLRCSAEGRDVFTFCMCAGGYVMPSVSQHGHFCTNGMSRSRHESPFANSGVVLTVDPATLVGIGLGGDDLVGVRWQAAIERVAYRRTGESYRAPIQWAADFLAQRPSRGTVPSSYRRGVVPGNLWEVLPRPIAESIARGLAEFDRRWNGLFLREATLVAPEARGSAPVRIPRDAATRESISLPGLYPIGEGAGYAGGIVSAAVDGLRTAKAVIRRYRPLAAR